MKLTTLATFAAVAVTTALAQTAAECNCQPNDQTCLTACVNTTGSCITQCKGDTTCYANCIHGWPGQSQPSGSAVATPSPSPGAATSPVQSPALPASTASTAPGTATSVSPTSSGTLAASGTSTPNAAGRMVPTAAGVVAVSLAVLAFAI